MTSELLCEVQDAIATVTINRPAFGNAFSESLFVEIKEVFDRLSADDTVGCVVLTGSGKNFSAGGDIASFQKLIASGECLTPEYIYKPFAMTRAVLDCAKPVIAMVNGAAAGAGCCLALACDFRVVTEKSRFIMAFINVALSGDSGGMYNLVSLVGMGRAREMMMTGEPVNGKQACEVGLASRLAEEGMLEATTYALAKKLASSPLMAIRKQKALFREFFYPDYEAFGRQEIAHVVECSRSKDFAEAVNAFLEKRPPVFSDR